MTQGLKATKGRIAIANNNGSIKMRWTYGGKRYNFSPGLKYTEEGLKAAEAKARQIELDILSGNFDPSLNKYEEKIASNLIQLPSSKPQVKLKDLWGQYLDIRAKNKSPNTWRTVYEPVSRFIEKIKVDGLENSVKFQSELLSLTTEQQARRVLMQLNACCKWGVKNQLIPSNPFDGKYLELDAGKPIPPMAFTAEERDRIIEAFKNDSRKGTNYQHYAPFVEFLFLTGCRPCEAVGLRWKNVYSNPTRILFCESIIELKGRLERREETKTGVKRWFTCGARLEALLEAIRPEVITSETLVFPSPKGKAIGLSNFNDRAWGKVLESLDLLYKDGVKMTAYNCRDTFITIQCANGSTSTQVAKWVGNSSKVIEANYLDKLQISQIKPKEI
jgi:integrase